jgi:serine/threonine-protein kinase
MDQANQESLASRLADILSGSYEIEGEIGRGGMGIVYSARDLKLKRRVAIKVLPPDLAFREEIRIRFTREAQTAARLQHPHIVPIHSVGDEGGLVYFVMAYVDGESLAARLRRRERLPIEEARRIMKETSDAMGMAHAMGVIHRDIKPDNILLEGTRRRVMVTDFGIAKALVEDGGSSLTGTGVAIGTPAYMSPEQASGDSEIDTRSDIYSLGVVGFEMLSGDVPFKAPTVAGILLKQVSEPVPDLTKLREDCPDELAFTVMRCLDKDPENRWPTSDALRRALESKTSKPYRPRSQLSKRPSRPSRERDREFWEWFADDAKDAPRSTRDRRPGHGRGLSERSRRPRERKGLQRRPTRAPDKAKAKGSEPSIVRKFRSNFASYVAVNGGLLLMNVVTGLDSPWFLFPAIGWGIGLASQYGRLWTSGYSMRDVLNRPAASDALPTVSGTAAKLPAAGIAIASMPEATTGEFGTRAEQIRQIQKDRQAIFQVVEKLPPAERELLPEIVKTVDSLAGRALELGTMLRQMEGSVSDSSVDSLDSRIEALKAEGADAESDRRLGLLQRQRTALVELGKRREKIEAQFESCVLAVQNVRFDLLRLRSAGVDAVLSDLTSATQQVRALQFDVEAAIEAAAEIKEALRPG